MDYSKANRLRIMIEAEKEAIAVSSKELRAMEQELREMCTHPENMVVHTEDYFSGSYYDTACTTHYYHCGICSIKVKERKESHSWYG